MTTLVPSDSMKRSLDRAVRDYAASLPGSAAEHYLKYRCLTSETTDYFRLGFVENPHPGHEQYRGRIAIPYLTRSGTISVRFRAVPENGDLDGRVQGPKMLSVIGDIHRPYNTMALARQESYVFICEGEMDAIICHQAGLPAVAFQGANAWHSRYWRMFRYRRVAVLADNDDNGQGMKFAEKVAHDVPECVVIGMPKGYDVNSLVIDQGVSALRKLVGFKNE